MRFTPRYSHGGPSEVNWTAVAGTGTTSGLPIDIGGADPAQSNWPVLEIFCAGNNATVLIEANGGLLDSTGNPPSGEWVDISNGGYAMTAGTNVAKRVPPNVPYVRTRISANSGATVTSYISCICYPGGRWGSAPRPTVFSRSQS